MSSLPRRPYAGIPFLRLDASLLRSEGTTLTIRNAADELLGSIVGLGHPVAKVGELLLAFDDGRLTLVDISDAAQPDPVVAYAPQLEETNGRYSPWEMNPAVGLAGIWNDHLVLRSENGVSVVDVSDPFAPSEVRCIPLPDVGENEEAQVIGVSGHFVVVKMWREPEPTGELLFYDLEGSSDVPSSMHPPIGENELVLHGDRMLIEYDGLTLYDMTMGTEPVELDHIAWDASAYGQINAGPPVIAQMAFLSLGNDHQTAYTVDLEGQQLRVLSGPSLEPVHDPGCVLTFQEVGGAETFAISPWWEPDTRFATDALPDHSCASLAGSAQGWTGAREPDGRRVAVQSWQGGVIVDIDTLEAVPAAALTDQDGPFGSPWWLPDGIVTLASVGGDIEDSSLDVVDPSRPSEIVRTIESPGMARGAAVAAGKLWVTSDPEEYMYPDEPFPPEKRVLWYVDGSDLSLDPITVALPPGTAPLALIGMDEQVAIVDGNQRLLVLDSEGAVVRDVAIAMEIEKWYERSAAAGSSLGAFVRDVGGLLWWLPADGDRMLPDLAGCREALPIGADTTRVFLDARIPGGDRWSGRRELQLAVPTMNGDGFSLELVARLPSRRSPKVAPGPELVMFQSEVVVAKE